MSERRYTSQDCCTACWYDNCGRCRGNGCACRKFNHPGVAERAAEAVGEGHTNEQ